MAVIAATVVVGACAPATNPPDPDKTAGPIECVGSFTWHQGSVPPPHSHNWTLTLHEGGTADFQLWSEHQQRGEPLFEELGFPVDENAASEFCTVVADIPDDANPRTGGSYVFWELSIGEGETTIPEDFRDATDKARDLIGEDRMAAGEQAYQEWKKTQGD